MRLGATPETCRVLNGNGFLRWKRLRFVVRVPNLDSCKQVTEREDDFVLLPFVFHLPIFVFFFMFHMEPGQVTIYSFGLGLEKKSILGFWGKTAHLLFSVMGAPAKIKGGGVRGCFLQPIWRRARIFSGVATAANNH